MDSTRDEENEYSSIDYNYVVVDREFTNLTSRNQLRSSEGNAYENPRNAVNNHEQTIFESGETLLPVKKKEKKHQKFHKSTICSIKYGLLILFILLTSALSLFVCLHYLGTQKEAMLNEEISKLKNNASILMDTISSQKKAIREKEATIDRHVADIGEAKNNASILMDTISSQKKAISEKEAAIASRDVDINRLEDKINELSPVQTSVMLLGGWHDYITSSTIIYNSMEKSWKKCKLTLPSALGDHGAALLNNEIYIFGGFENGATRDALKSLYKFGAGNKWERMTDMTEKRKSISQSSIVFNSEIWVIGGWNGTNPLKSVEKYNPKTNNWTKMPKLNELRSRAAATIIDGKIYVSGGFGGWQTTNSVEVYDPEKGKWEIFTPSMPYGAHSHILIGNHSQLIAIGGDLSLREPTSQVWEMDVLNPKREWKEMPSLKQKRYYSGAAIIDDELMIFGGSTNNTNRIDSVEIFDGVEWKSGAPLPEIRGIFASIPLTFAQEKLFLKRFCQNS